jgi:hypothetical protein
VGQKVEPGQLLGLVNPVLALDEVAARVARLDMSEADRRASEKTRDEYKQRWENMIEAGRRAARPAQDDLRAAGFAHARYLEEEVAKAAAVRQAERELSAAVTVLQMYEIRGLLRGVIKHFYKNPGEAVKNLEPVLLIQGTK